MSYSFNWDCTLPINNIADIVSLNIVPNTKAHDEGDYLSLRGEVAIDGEYLTTQGTQKTFTEHIPLDITLPNNGKNNEINTDITNFDYDINDENSLSLSLNLTLEGYDLGDVMKLVDEDHHEEDSQTQAPVMFNKGATIAPATGNVEAVKQEIVELEPVVQEVNEIEVVEDDSDYIDFDEVVFDHTPVQEAIDPSLAEDRKEALTDKIKKVIEKQSTNIKESKTPETVVEKVIEPVVEEVVEEVKVEEVVEPVVEKVVEEVKVENVEPVVEEVVEEVKVEKVHHKPVPEIPVVHQSVIEEETEEILPFPIKKETVVEKVSETQPKSEIFDMLYSLEGDHPIVNESVEEVVETTVETEPQQTETGYDEAELVEVAEKIEELTPAAPVSVVKNEDSIANQFSDGESVLKVIFVQEEETTITNICTKYGVSEKEIYNKEELATPLRCGDRVMINYGKLR